MAVGHRRRQLDSGRDASPTTSGSSGGCRPVEAAIEAGKERLRPVLMTAGAMLLGMLPMSIGAGEGGEQNAPLGRAVIGGLSVATIVTLCIVPVIYTMLARGMPGKYIVEKRFEAEAKGRGVPWAPVRRCGHAASANTRGARERAVAVDA